MVSCRPGDTGDNIISLIARFILLICIQCQLYVKLESCSKRLGDRNSHSRLLLPLGGLGLSPAQSCSPPELHPACLSVHTALLSAQWHAHSLGSALQLQKCEQRDQRNGLELYSVSEMLCNCIFLPAASGLSHDTDFFLLLYDGYLSGEHHFQLETSPNTTFFPNIFYIRYTL